MEEDDANEWDVSLFSYEEFIDFFFDQPAEEKTGDIEKDRIYAEFGSGPFLKEVEKPERVIEHLTKLFIGFDLISAKYSERQVNQAIWAIWGSEFELQKTLWNPSVELTKRVECIRAMYQVYANFVSKSQVQVMENCFDMWWDWICSDFWFQVSYTKQIQEGDLEKLSPDERRLLDCMFETLSRILRLNDPRTQSFALHGLGHLHHPDVKSLVQNFIDENRQKLNPQGLVWMEKCRDGTVM
jgi:hypothetical protein